MAAKGMRAPRTGQKHGQSSAPSSAAPNGAGFRMGLCWNASPFQPLVL